MCVSIDNIRSRVVEYNYKAWFGRKKEVYVMKKVVSLLLVFVMGFVFSACSVNPDKYSLAGAAKAMAVQHFDTNQEGYKEFMDKLDAFAAKLTHEVYSDSDKQANICISPVSVYMALALAVECAEGNTREEILSAVGVTYDEVWNFTKVLYGFSNREYYYTDMKANKEILAFEELANSIWVDESTTLKEDVIDSLSNNYNCDLFSVDFKTNEGAKAINAYIKEKTHGIINGDIEFSPETLFTIINTFYLKEVWNRYGKDLTLTDKAYDFKAVNGSVTSTRLLRGYYQEGKAYEGEGYTAFYTKTAHGVAIKFIVPDDERSLSEVFTASNLYGVNNIADYGHVDEENKLLHYTRVLFPEYKASFDGDLKSILKNDFGINELFDLSACDFSKATDVEQIACDGVVHKCSVDVNKTGIEGAAVTVMPAAGAGAPLEGYEEVYHEFVVDRAFGFVMTDSNGTVIFSGVVNGLK